MTRGRSFALFLALSLMANAFCVPTSLNRRRKAVANSQLNSKESLTTSAAKESKEISKYHSSAEDLKTSSTTTVAIEEDKSDDDDDDFGNDNQNSPPSSGGGSNVFSLLNLASALFPASGSSGTNTQTSSTSPQSPLWTFKMDVLRAILQFGTSMIALASSTVTNSST